MAIALTRPPQSLSALKAQYLLTCPLWCQLHRLRFRMWVPAVHMEGGQFAGRSPSPTSGHQGELSDLLGHGQLQPLVCFMWFFFFLLDGGFFTGIKKRPITWYWVGQKLHSHFSVPSYRKTQPNFLASPILVRN